MRITKVSDMFSVSPQIQYEHVKTIADQGFCTIINHRPDGEAANQPLSKALAKAAKQADILYHHIPFKPGKATQADKDKVKDILKNSDGPILSFCGSGMRARSVYKSVTSTPSLLGKLFGR